MAVYFEFVRGSVAATLQEVDKKICESYGIECNDIEWSTPGQAVTFIGKHASAQTGVVTPETLRAAIEELRDVYHISPADEGVLWRFLCGEYVFRSWRG